MRAFLRSHFDEIERLGGRVVDVRTNKSHQLTIERPDGETVRLTVSMTPSDHRAWMKSRAYLRRLFRQKEPRRHGNH